MSFKAMEKAIQDFSHELKQRTIGLNDNNFQMSGTASNSSTNSCMISAGMDDNSDRERVIAITKRLVESMTRSPERCQKWLICDKIAQEELNFNPARLFSGFLGNGI